MIRKIYIAALLLTVVTAGATFAHQANAESNAEFRAKPMLGLGGRGMGDQRPAVIGAITAVNGTTITVLGRSFGTTTASTTYTVNAASTTIERANAKISVSDLVIGDMVMVRGTASGTVITATDIRTGIMKGIVKQMEREDDRKNGSSTMMEGNGQPIIGGTVTAVSSTTITITNKSNVTYTIDATTAKITTKGKIGAIGDIKVGDTILAQGTVNGTSVVAVTVVDQGGKAAENNGNGKGPGFFGRIGSFFAHLFGF